MKLLYFFEEEIVIINLFILCIPIGPIGLTNGYPVKKDLVESETNNETSFPNGTIVGKYNYKDNDGNPVHVKYFADASGYGVELKTIKMNTADAPCHDKLNNIKYMLQPEAEQDTTSTTLSPITDVFTSTKPPETPKDSKNIEGGEGAYKGDPDYEIFVNNELKTSKKCGQEKVHVYHEKTKRKSRTVSEFDAMSYCEQMFS
ncbi:uncharacterized protein LOC128670776 [Plodia interpunctella]|uniref:uncharacterized protein LOC128670776 n=1 Tax=Plodia interpunctella TaxID=58824 RepID=UPI0023674994|nr:uncharacterized protein LOC128670776 [Plodia interpunctella]